jgi:hypothetical protein
MIVMVSSVTSNRYKREMEMSYLLRSPISSHEQIVSRTEKRLTCESCHLRTIKYNYTWKYQLHSKLPNGPQPA